MVQKEKEKPVSSIIKVSLQQQQQRGITKKLLFHNSMDRI